MQVMMSIVVWEISLPCSVEFPPNPTRAEETPPNVTAIPIHERYVRSRAAGIYTVINQIHAPVLVQRRCTGRVHGSVCRAMSINVPMYNDDSPRISFG